MVNESVVELEYSGVGSRVTGLGNVCGSQSKLTEAKV